MLPAHGSPAQRTTMRAGLRSGAAEGMVRHDVEVTDRHSSARQHARRADWQRRHRLLQWVLLAHVPAAGGLGLALGNPPLPLVIALVIPLVCAVAGHLARAITGGSGRLPSPPGWCAAPPRSWAHQRHHRGPLPLLHHHRLHRALPGLGAVPAERRSSPWSATASARCGCGTLIFNHPAAQAQPVAVVARSTASRCCSPASA